MGIENKDILSSTLTRIREIEDAGRAKTEETQRQERERSSQAQQQNQGQQQLQQQAFQTKRSPTPTQPPSQTHESPHDEREQLQNQRQRNFQQTVQQGQQLRETQGLGVKEQLQTQFTHSENPLPQNQSPRAPTVTANLLQNIRAATQSNSPETHQASQNQQNANAHSSQSNSQPALRLGDLTRQMGIYDGRLPQQGPTLQADTLLQRSAQNFTNSSRGSESSRMGRSYPAAQPTLRLPQAQFQQLFSNSISQLFHLSNGETQLPPVAVLVENGHVFLREGNKVRVFQLLQDGEWREVLEEGASESQEGHDMSPEARRLIQVHLKQKGLQSKLGQEEKSLQAFENDASLELKETSEINASHGDLEFKAPLKSLWKDGSSFSHLLRKILEEDYQVGSFLSIGEELQFAEKSEWPAFFSRMLEMNSAERQATKSFDELFDFLFRGLFDKEGFGRTLVSDFKYISGKKSREEKFAQIALSGVDADLLEYLNELKPGQKISHEKLLEFLGKELSYLQLAHISEAFKGEMLSNTYKDIQFNAASKINPYAQAKMEQLLFAKTRSESPLILDQIETLISPVDAAPKWKVWFEGNSKWLTYVGYGVIAFVVLLFLVFSLGKG